MTKRLFFFLCLVLWIVLISMIFFFCTLRHEHYSDRFFYYTSFLKNPRNRINVYLSQLQHKYSHEFPKDQLLQYFAMDFKTCHTLFTSKQALPFSFSYIKDLYEVWVTLDESYKRKNRFIVWYPRDRVERFFFPVLVKSRIIENPQQEYGSILFKLNTLRHFDKIKKVHKDDIRFEKKNPVLIWRGAPTGYGFGNNIPYRTVSRETLVKKYHSHGSPLIDVGLVIKKDCHSAYAAFQKKEMSVKDMLRYKYILSVEGNDVATNLKWAMSSNSLVVMPRPQICSWFMEEKLEPYVHYLPVRDDFDDLESQVRWAESNPQKCKQIVRNAQKYVKTFLDEKQELNMCKSVLKYYLDTFHWT